MLTDPWSVKLSTVAFKIKSAVKSRSRPTGIFSIKAVTLGPIIPSSWNIRYSAVSRELKSSRLSLRSILSPFDV